MMYSIYMSLSSIFKQKSIYFMTTLFTMLGFLILSVILTIFFNEYNFIQESLRNSSLKDVLINNDYRTKDNGFEELMKFEATKRTAGAYPSDDCIITRQDLEYIKENFKGKLDFKVMLYKNFLMPYGEDVTNFQRHLYFISDDYMDFFRKQTNIEGDCIITSKQTIDMLKQAHIQGIREDLYKIIRQFPVVYNPENDMFMDLNNEREIQVIFLDDITDFDKFDNFFVENIIKGSDIYDANTDNWEYYIFLPFNLYYDVYHPFDNLTINMRATPSDVNMLSELLFYLNVAHQGKTIYTYNAVIDVFLDQIKEQVSFLAILTPLTVIILLVVCMNFTGLQIMNIQKERKNIAIRIACGATRREILLGYLLKSFVCMIFSAVSAVTLSIIFINKYKINMFRITIVPSIEASLCVIALAAVLSILSVLPTLLKAARLSPATILSEESKA